ncbi:hypothetical protein MRBLMN1_004289 [Chitinophaga ginsengisegetis]|uniref:hypothetical protein n=1 Tax=Chitinophaga ginsengisegetis TaxID=393003 RepID=UPI000DBA600B|nr:hypothetical protein [Chitinophaga ginsengisegetis]MDR6567131.1 hypothetical protein [Chitinophaga ginsengisegetis]MDR6646861.1 hypothetical protein [Chitinophaga ginsengisegetis]MDR6653211.1 hypothetical protein [Chitinophaga ginsengisegetis]
MNDRAHILKRWTLVCFLLCLQLVTGVLPSFAAHRHYFLLPDLHKQQVEQDRLLSLVNKIPVHLEADDEGTEVWHITKHRRKTRWYLSAAAPQVSTATRIVYLDADNTARSIYIPENKTGEYGRQKSFRPAYYSFLFRFTPF